MGNARSRRPTGGTPTTFTWDDQNRLKVWTDGTTRATLTYNADGQRMRLQRSAGGDFRWVWDEQAVLLETGDTGSTVEVDTHRPGGFGGLISRRRLSGGVWTPRYGLWDVLGSLDRETGATETQEVNKYIYKAFGDIASETAVNVATNYRYIGQLGYYYDRITPALPTYVRARYLTTSFGRWMSQDPLGVLGPDGANLYWYVRNRPTSWIDPSGMSNCIPDGIGHGVEDLIAYIKTLTPEQAKKIRKCLRNSDPKLWGDWIEAEKRAKIRNVRKRGQQRKGAISPSLFNLLALCACEAACAATYDQCLNNALADLDGCLSAAESMLPELADEQIALCELESELAFAECGIIYVACGLGCLLPF